MKNFLKELVNKYWDKIESQTIGCGFSRGYEEDIKRDIRKELDNLIVEHNSEEIYNAYKNDTDDYVKYYAYIEILKILVKEIEKTYSHDISEPKRFKKYYGPRD